jgi:hypothetical protein
MTKQKKRFNVITNEYGLVKAGIIKGPAAKPECVCCGASGESKFLKGKEKYYEQYQVKIKSIKRDRKLLLVDSNKRRNRIKKINKFIYTQNVSMLKMTKDERLALYLKGEKGINLN